MFRKHVPFYVRGLPEASQLRQFLMEAKTAAEIEDKLRSSLG
jgi:tRNA-dihydrouridine synthase